MKKGIAILSCLLLAVTVLFVSCGGKSTTTSMELVIMNGTEPQSLDPSQVTGVPEHRINLALFEGLVGYDPRTSKAVPGVAESWSYSSNNTVITFRLRQGIVWSDGTPITAQTFVDSWLHHLNPTTASEYAYLIGMVVKGADEYNIGEGSPQDVAIRAVDERTFEVTMLGPAAYALDMFAHYAFNPLPMHVIRQYGNNWTRPGNFVGNGPFVLQEHIPNSRIVVVPNDKYWNKANVAITKITFDATEDDNTMYQAYINGEADWSTGIPLSRIDEIKLRSDFQSSAQLGTYYFLINCVDHPPLRDPRVRKALSMGFNRQELVDSILRGGQIPSGALVPPMTGYDPTPGNLFNVTEARRLLADAGYPDGQGLPTFEIVYNSGVEGHRIISEYLQQSWRTNLGVQTRLANMEWASYLDYRDTPSMQLARAGWLADYMDPQNFLELLLSDTGNNDGKYSDAEYDRLILQAASMPDGADRMRLMRQAEDIAITRDQAMIPIYHYVSQNMIDLTKWDGWYPNPMDTHPYVGLKRK
ncbi:MAG: peptide ABC transporter substrate-binding protein [Treponema sp.]|nr:peptide ABC transporter substrate-binding protein [Treponema sp.]